jgi:hypothetical protein
MLHKVEANSLSPFMNGDGTQHKQTTYQLLEDFKWQLLNNAQPKVALAIGSKVRRKGGPQQTATFTRLTDAKRWAQITEGSILENRHFKSVEAKRHTLADLIDRCVAHVLPTKAHSSQINQRIHLKWWHDQIGELVLASVTLPLKTIDGSFAD